jgi:hypothetical protein
MLIKNIRHVGIVTLNMKQSINFYKNILGLRIFEKSTHSHFSLGKIMKLKNVRINIVRLKSKVNNTTIELLDWRNPKSKLVNKKNVYSQGLTHIALTVNNLEKVYDKLVKNNIEVLSKPFFGINKKLKYMFCKSPENIFVELVQDLQKNNNNFYN